VLRSEQVKAQSTDDRGQNPTSSQSAGDSPESRNEGDIEYITTQTFSTELLQNKKCFEWGNETTRKGLGWIHCNLRNEQATAWGVQWTKVGTPRPTFLGAQLSNYSELTLRGELLSRTCHNLRDALLLSSLTRTFQACNAATALKITRLMAVRAVSVSRFDCQRWHRLSGPSACRPCSSSTPARTSLGTSPGLCSRFGRCSK